MQTPLSLPALNRLASVERVLVAGAGGGFDVYAGLPLVLALRRSGVHVELANLSFTPLDHLELPWPHPHVAEVRADTPPAPYFPEQLLAGWLSACGSGPARVFCLRNSNGVAQTRAAYEWLASELELDAVVLVDGGTDSLMRGDEFGLGTPVEDFVSIAAAASLDLPVMMLASVGFGVDHYHGVCHAQVLRAVADLSREGGFFGATSLVMEMPEVAAYLDAVHHAQTQNARPSIVSASISDAIQGHFGDYHSTRRTSGSTLFINPLMALCWFFDLERVAERVQFLDAIRDTRSWGEVRDRIAEHRQGLESTRPWEDIPH